MNILFIWLGKTEPLYEWRTMCIRRAKEVYPDANFKCITHMRAFFCMELINPSEIDLSEYNANEDNYCGWSDYARLWYLSKHPNTLYMDTDTWCNERMPFSPECGNAGFEAIWNGTELDKMKAVLNRHNNRRLLYRLGNDLTRVGRDLNKYFKHKPLWAKKYRQIK